MAENKSKEQRIKQIIETAILEFIDKGYEGTSMESIAKKANLSKGGLYHHFKSKDEIMVEANNRFIEPIFELVELSEKNASPSKALKTYIIEYLKYWHNHPKELQFSFLSVYKVMSHQYMWDDMNTYLKYFTDYFKRMLSSAIECGELKQHDTESRALAMASSMDGITAYLLMCKDVSIEKIAEHLIETFISELETNKHE